MLFSVVAVLAALSSQQLNLNVAAFSPINASVNNVHNNNVNVNNKVKSALFSSTTNDPLASSSSSTSPAVPTSTDCDDTNTPPSLARIQASIHSIKSGSDIRGTFVDHSRVGSILNVSSAISSSLNSLPSAGGRFLTPFAAYCYGAAFAKMVQIRSGKGSAVQFMGSNSNDIGNGNDTTSMNNILFPQDFTTTNNNKKSSMEITNICLGRDPRPSGTTLTDAFCRGVESIPGVKAYYTDLATTPAMFAFCRSNVLQCDGAVMVTASHLPTDKNGLKFFTRNNGGLNKADIQTLAESACVIARNQYDEGVLPQTSGPGAVYCSQFVDYMPLYMESLRNSIHGEVNVNDDVNDSDNDNVSNDMNDSDKKLPLDGLRIVLNAGNGAGYFFNQVLEECGADVSNSIHLTPNGIFPKKTGVPNPEYQPMIEETTEACMECNADIGIMLDTDADRCGFVLPTNSFDTDGTRTYEALNRNRLIALLGVIFSSTSPGCTIVTDSVTSEGLATFLQHNLKLNHVRYLKGYANVIGKAKELTESGKAVAEVAIETSGHCAMRENGYLDDGTYTSVKVIGLLARFAKKDKSTSLFDLIAELEELDEVKELRMEVGDGSIETTKRIFNRLQSLVEAGCDTMSGWELDEENLEGVRVRIGDGGFFMLRMSLHDPILSLQIEGREKETIQNIVIGPLLKIIEGCEDTEVLDLDALKSYGN